MLSISTTWKIMKYRRLTSSQLKYSCDFTMQITVLIINIIVRDHGIHLKDENARFPWRASAWVAGSLQRREKITGTCQPLSLVGILLLSSCATPQTGLQLLCYSAVFQENGALPDLVTG
ncbi:hypothetical protein E2C01_056553 [Portunus trituberculatus]|uniref:Uncharacterized protein n=1 Tax=Portunus trituberculatus TaxID=210409 RepID=A0A5B7GZW1_PORTR|nr:hypothetical protein [Portunus trituberculatus]